MVGSRPIVHLLNRVTVGSVMIGFIFYALIATNSIVAYYPDGRLGELNRLNYLLSLVLFGLVVSLFLVDVFFNRGGVIRMNVPIFLTLLVLLSAVISVFLGSDRLSGSIFLLFSELYWLLFAMFTGFAVYCYLNSHRLQLIPKIIFFYGLLNLIVFPFTKDLPASGMFKDRNDASLFFVMIMLFLFMKMLNPAVSKNVKVFFGICWLAFFVIIIQLSSRSGFLIFVVAHSVAVFFTRNMRTYLSFAFFGLMVTIPYAISMKTRVEKEHMLEVNWSDLGRIAAFGAGLNMVKEHPIRGVGLNRSYDLSVFREYANPSLPSKEGIYQIHNMYLGIAAEQGVGAAILFIVLNGVVIVRLWGSMCHKKLEEIELPLFFFTFLVSYLLFAFVFPSFLAVGLYWILLFSSIWIIQHPDRIKPELINNVNLSVR